MPDTNPYGEPVPTWDGVTTEVRPVRVADRGPDPRRLVAETLRKVGEWDHIDYSDIVLDVTMMQPDAAACALCNEEECEPGCPMMRWRGQA